MTYYPPLLPFFKRGLSLICLITFIYLVRPGNAESQVLRVLTNNTFAGTINGAFLGGATMVLTNNDDFEPVRVGVGLGTLSGMGIGIYDASMNPGYIQGTFNTVNSSGYIILIDTFYGAATGTVAGMAISLLGNNRIGDGAQYGAGAGAWVGFSFGLVDAFYLSRETSGGVDYFSSEQSSSGNGLVQWQPGENTLLGFINPSLYAFPDLEGQALTISSQFGMEFASISFRF
ncbi:MAG: hypothetical protein WEB89_03660 [Balneolales bacterium]